MKKLSASLLIGFVAGIIDVVPMIIQKLNWYANLSAFIHWLVLGIIISYTQMNLKSWFKGLLISELSALSIIIMTIKEDPASCIPIIIMSALLGALTGIFTEKYAR